MCTMKVMVQYGYLDKVPEETICFSYLKEYFSASFQGIFPPLGPLFASFRVSDM